MPRRASTAAINKAPCLDCYIHKTGNPICTMNCGPSLASHYQIRFCANQIVRHDGVMLTPSRCWTLWRDNGILIGWHYDWSRIWKHVWRLA